MCFRCKHLRNTTIAPHYNKSVICTIQPENQVTIAQYKIKAIEERTRKGTKSQAKGHTI